MKFVKYLFSIFFLFSLLQAEEPGNNHNFCAGVEVLRYQISDHMDKVKVDGNQFFDGIRLQYEYKPLEGIYFAADTFFTTTDENEPFNFEHSSQNTKFKLNDRWAFGGVELRLGNSFDQGYYSFCPFIAFGGYLLYDVQHNSLRHGELDRYVGCGCIFNKTLNCYMDIGFRTKALIIRHGACVRYRGYYYIKKSGECGLEVAIPLKLHLYKQYVNFKIEPYFLTLSMRNKNFVYGSSFLLDLAF